MEDGHLAAFWRFLDRGFCRDRDFADLILFIRIPALAVCPLFVDGRIGPGHPFVGLRCRGAGMRQGPVRTQICTTAGTEIR